MDFYNTKKYKEFTAQQLVEELEELYFKKETIPYPNGIVMSGGGIYLVWWFKFTPGMEGTILKRRVVTKILYEMLKEYGSDAKTLTLPTFSGFPIHITVNEKISLKSGHSSTN